MPSRRGPGAGLVVAVALAAGTIAHPVGRAQPAAELSRARDLYASAEAAMKDGRFDDAARDYGAAYESSKDPALFYKIARANERAGRCEVALIYYARYLREGRPSEQFVAVTHERIAACGGDAHRPDGAPSAGSAAPPGAGSAAPPDGGAGSAAAAAGAHATSSAAPATTAGSAAPATAGRASGADRTGRATTGGAATTGAAATIPTDRHKIAWVLTGSAIALVTLGGVLANAASSSENDIRDLYVGFAGRAPAFDAETRRRYDDLVDQGHRYEHLSWASFGLAGAAAVGAAIMFVTGRAPSAEHARIAPVVTTRTAGVALTF